MGAVDDGLSTLRSPPVAAMIDRVHAAAAHEDELARRRVYEREAQIGHRLPQAQRYELYGEAPLAIKREVGELLYVLAVGRPGRRIVEFGASHGLSTVYLAAALRDSGGGALVTTERHPAKAETAARNLTDAGLSDLVEVRVGNALQTLGPIAEPVDFLFLDGSNDPLLAGTQDRGAAPTSQCARGCRLECRRPRSTPVPSLRPQCRQWIRLCRSSAGSRRPTLGAANDGLNAARDDALSERDHCNLRWTAHLRKQKPLDRTRQGELPCKRPLNLICPRPAGVTAYREMKPPVVVDVIRHTG
jgi:predicted O-methyltransferase YrrM